MTPRSAQLLTAALAVLLVVLMGATVFVLLSRPDNGPTASPGFPATAGLPSPSATAIAVVMPSASAALPTDPPPTEPPPTAEPTAPPTPSPLPAATPEPTASPSPGLTASPTALITLSPSPAPSPTPLPTLTAVPTPSPTPTPSISPTAPERQLRLVNVGFDSATEGGDARYVEVNVDGPSRITASLSDVSSSTVRVCIIRQDPSGETVCNKRNGPAIAVTAEAGSSVWLVQARGREANIAPSGNLTITFHSLAPTAILRSFRYNGMSEPARNGYTAEFRTLADGEISVRGNFEGDTYSYRLVIQPCADPVCDQTNTGENFEATLAGVADTGYAVSIFSPDQSTNPGGPAFVQSTLSWQ